ncbi:F-box protein FBW2-like isoform X2 [Andrographis paniculata]|nr:F-box protein FBW2-like isoform X2 [Andrographis paniculata]
MAEEAGDLQRWDELLPDALGLIFKHLSLQEVLTVVPCVCKSWRRVVMGPYCWQEIDLDDWSRSTSPANVDRMLQLLIPRSGGSLRKLSVSGLASEESFTFIANHVRALQTLWLPRCHVPDGVVENAAGMFRNLTNLDLSYCLNVGAGALQAIGCNCRSLTTLRRVMHPLEVINRPSQDDEGLAVASTMPRLRHLEIAYMLLSTSTAQEIIRKCTSLELLDIRGCWEVYLDEEFASGFPNLQVVGPNVVDPYSGSAWDNLSDSGSSGYLGFDFIAGDPDDEEEYEELWGGSEGEGQEEEGEAAAASDDDEDVEMWWYYYGDIQVADIAADWPQSP